METKIHGLILNMVRERKEAAYHRNDLLQSLIDGCEKNNISGYSLESFIVDNCKNIYLAGYETNALTTAWSLMLLASNPEWQARVRTEVLQVCNGRKPDADMLPKMKLVPLFLILFS